MKNLAVTLCLALAVYIPICQNLRADDPKSTPAPADKKSMPQLIDASEAEKLIAAKKVVVLDVRTPAEFAAGHIQGATNLDIHDQAFQTKLEQLDKDQPYLVHCAAGVRSAKACNAMSALHFKTLYDLKGGLGAWEKAGKRLVK